MKVLVDAGVHAKSPPAVSAAPHEHLVQFYDGESFLAEVVADFALGGFRAGEPVVVIATAPHRSALCERLAANGYDVDLARASGRFVLLDAEETLATFMRDGAPDWTLFRKSIGAVLERAQPKTGSARVRAYGEMVDVLWRAGNSPGAIRLEELWNDLAGVYPFSLLCAYQMTNFVSAEDCAPFERICRTHTHAFPTEAYQGARDVDDRSHEIAMLQQQARVLERELAQRKQLEQELRDALARTQEAEAELNMSRQEIADFFENAVEGLHAIGPDGIIKSANRAELELFGYSKDEYVGHHIGEFHVDRATVDDMLRRLSRNESLRDYEARRRCKDGTIKHVLLHSNVLFRDGKFVHTRCFTRDISDRKHLEEQLRRQNEDLVRTVHFSEMFVGMLGHDLRNPLFGIVTAASLLARRADDKVTRPARRILNSAGRMARMVDQLLDFTRIRLGGSLSIQRTNGDFGQICQSMIEELAQDGRSVEVNTSGDLVGSWDCDRLSQLVSNLVGNALTHGTPGAVVRVRVDGTEPASVRLEVHNHGHIPPAVLPALFEPLKFERNRKYDRTAGLGLGLYIAQQIARAHGAMIDVASSEIDGTRFVVDLPRSAPLR